MPRALIFEYWHTSSGGIFRGLVIRRRGLIFLYLGDGLWRKHDLEALARHGQVVEFQEGTRRERVNR
jgi:hypothetical protein